MTTITREAAVELARQHAKLRPESYYSEPFEPHEWVVNAIQNAYQQGHEAAGKPADVARYGWLRDGNAYAPEEAHVRGGDALDQLCDAGLEAR